MSDNNAEVIHLELYSEDMIDPNELDQLTYRLYQEIKKAGIQSVKVVKREELPEGAKTAELGIMAAIAIELIRVTGPPLMEILVDWFKRRKTDKVKLGVHFGDQVVRLRPKMAAQEITDATRKVTNAVEARETESAGRRVALVIGNSEHEDSRLTKLVAPGTDTQTLAEILKDPEIGGFDDVTILLNATASKTRSAIELFFKNRTRKDLLLLYFSGHGLREELGNLFLTATDTRTDLIRATGIAADFVSAEMERSYSQRKVLILDCCYSGAFVPGLGPKGAQAIGSRLNTISAFQGSGFGQVVLTASDKMQYAWEGDEIVGEGKTSIFTHYLVEGLRTGKADADGDGLISLTELYHYVYEHVRHKQTPSISSTAQQGQLIIARNPHLVIQPAELPGELREALKSPHLWMRKGAVDELGLLLNSSQPEMALAAEQELERLVQDDSRAISSAAAQHLKARHKASQPVSVQPKPSPVHPRPEPRPAPLPPQPQKPVSLAQSCLLYLVAWAVPPLGFILWLNYKNKAPESNLKLARNLLIISVIMTVVWFVFLCGLLGSLG